MSGIKVIRTRTKGRSQGWAAVGEHGGVEFWFDEHDRIGKLGGVETHWSHDPPDYMDGGPHHTDCEVTGGNCWHEGTSLWASEHWIPMYERFGEAWVREKLVKLYRETFEAAK